MNGDETELNKEKKKSQMNANGEEMKMADKTKLKKRKQKKGKPGNDPGQQTWNALNDESGKQKLIEGIREDARQEAEKIIKEAETYAENRKQGTTRQVEKIMSDARVKADEQVAFIQRNIKSSIAVEIKRLNLTIMERMMDSTIEKAKQQIADKIGTPEYPEILLGWIVEAVLGLNVDEANVHSSREDSDYITAELLKKAADTVFTLTGKKVVLKKSTGDPLLAQGVVLYAMDGKTAFNNQVPTRLLRYQSEVRKMIYSSLYEK